MPREFNSREKTEITRALNEKGRKLFAKYGLKRTRIEELTRAAGISQGAFYRFYGSKEELYFDILEHEEQKLGERIMTALGEKELTRFRFREIMRLAFELFQANPFLVNFVENNDYQQIVRKIPEERLKNHMRSETRMITAAIEQHQANGCLKMVTPEVLGGLFYAVFLLYLHREEIGREVFPDVISLLTDIMADGLATKGRKIGFSKKATYTP